MFDVEDEIDMDENFDSGLGDTDTDMNMGGMGWARITNAVNGNDEANEENIDTIRSSALVSVVTSTRRSARLAGQLVGFGYVDGH